jgi:5S rRNA maturation endonuclease (ribonuclease M5)
MLTNGNFSSFNGNEFKSEEPKAIEVIKVNPIEQKALKCYLSQRGLPFSIAQAYCSEVHYKTRGKTYYAIGFKNDKEGWELRNSLFKGCISPKAITTIKGPGKGLNIFEGFSDFLSCLAFYKAEKLMNTTVVLNSVTNYRYIEEKVKEYASVNLFLDNDPAGEKLARKIEESNQNVKNISRSIYPNHKDFNHFLTNKQF